LTCELEVFVARGVVLSLRSTSLSIWLEVPVRPLWTLDASPRISPGFLTPSPFFAIQRVPIFDPVFFFLQRHFQLKLRTTKSLSLLSFGFSLPLFFGPPPFLGCPHLPHSSLGTDELVPHLFPFCTLRPHPSRLGSLKTAACLRNFSFLFLLSPPRGFLSYFSQCEWFFFCWWLDYPYPPLPGSFESSTKRFCHRPFFFSSYPCPCVGR